MAKKKLSMTQFLINLSIAVVILGVMALFFMDTTTLKEGLENNSNKIKNILNNAEKKIGGIKEQLKKSKEQVEKSKKD